MFRSMMKVGAVVRLLAVLALALSMMTIASSPASADDTVPSDASTSQCPQGTNPGDINGDNVANELDCDHGFNDDGQINEPPFNCPDGETPEDDNGDGVLTIEDCVIVVCQSHCEPPKVDACPTLKGSQPKGADCTPPQKSSPVSTPKPAPQVDAPTSKPSATPKPTADACPTLKGSQPKGADCTPKVEVSPVSQPLAAPPASGDAGNGPLKGGLVIGVGLLILGALIVRRRQGERDA